MRPSCSWPCWRRRCVRRTIVVYDPWSVAQAIIEVFNLVRQYTEMIRQAQRLPVDLATRYRGQSVAWTLQDLGVALRAAVAQRAEHRRPDRTRRTGRSSTRSTCPPTSWRGCRPSCSGGCAPSTPPSNWRTASPSAASIRSAPPGRLAPPCCRPSGPWSKTPPRRSTPSIRETALLNKINTASVLGLRLADQSNQFLLNTVEQLLVDTTRKRDTEATVMDATIYQWRYGQAYGADLFRNTATDLDTWRMR